MGTAAAGAGSSFSGLVTTNATMAATMTGTR